jgi:acetyl coenzyme A synthetase (ADP forming)-like protein
LSAHPSSPIAAIDPSFPAASRGDARGADVALRDGSTLRVRPLASEDGPAMRVFLDGLSLKSIGFRFFGRVDLDWAASWAMDMDSADRYALVATTGPEHAIVAHAAYIRTGEDRAEVAFAVADAWQGQGIATIMLAHLAAGAEEHGIAVFTAEVLPTNHRMIAVFRDSGFAVTLRSGDGVIEVELPTSRSEQTRERFQAREQTAAIAAVERFLRPRAVAVIGASRRPGTVGWEILRNIRSGGFTGKVYAVNRGPGAVQGQRAYASIADVPEPVDLAVIVIPAAQVCAAARECAAAGARALLVISAGFAEVGGDGVVRQEQLLAICRDAGMRLVGPNCLGVLSTAPDVRLDATFAGAPPLPGRVGFLSQSGGLGIAILEAAGRLGLGLSAFVSVGNKVDLSGNDLLEYWERDPGTDVILLYLESFGNPRRFARIARRVGRCKPIAAVKSGRSPAGARASASHTGALLSASDVTVDALFRQAGVIRTDTMHELFDVGALLSAQPVPVAGRVAIVTNAGGPGILCADACQAAGLDVVALDEDLRSRLGAFLAPEASLGNPIDMIATASAESYGRTIEALVQARACDAIIAIFVPPLVTRADDVARAIRAAGAGADGVTLLSVFMNSEGAPSAPDGEAHVPDFAFPEDAARALAHAAAYGRWRAQPVGRAPELAGCRPDEAAAIVAEGLAAGGGWLGPAQVWALLDCYGLAPIDTRVVSGAQEAASTAQELGVPVALKAIASGLLHKTDAGGVRLGLDGPQAVSAAAREIGAAVSAAGHELEGLIVQPMAQPGVELLMGVVHDESFGPVIACGAGGTSAEVLGDVAVRITPLTDSDAREMLCSLRTFALLEGYRGAPACDVGRLEELLLRLSALVDAHPEIVELDANPVIAAPAGATIVDARIRLAAALPPAPLFSL